jgi:hypothetical protein
MVRALWPEQSQQMLDELMLTGFSFPSKAALLRARPRLDVATMLLERYEWALGMFAKSRGNLASVHMTADGSPNSGRDLFGILMDVFVSSGALHHRVLPGTSLGHGFMSVIDKCMSLLWSMWLIVGPLMSTLEDVLLSVRSFTADFGIESKLGDVANILEHFAKSVGQHASPNFSKHRFLLPNCVYIPDWNHLIMNLLKRVRNSPLTWPARLSKLRELCAFFRNFEYRSCFKQSMIEACLFQYANDLEHFTATFASWRYETVCNVFVALLRLRPFCEEQFNVVVLGEVQEGALVNQVEEACNDKELWRLWI